MKYTFSFTAEQTNALMRDHEIFRDVVIARLAPRQKKTPVDKIEQERFERLKRAILATPNDKISAIKFTRQFAHDNGIFKIKGHYIDGLADAKWFVEGVLDGRIK